MLKPGEAAILILRRVDSPQEQYEVFVRHLRPQQSETPVAFEVNYTPVQELHEISDLAVALEFGVRALRQDALRAVA